MDFLGSGGFCDGLAKSPREPIFVVDDFPGDGSVLLSRPYFPAADVWVVFRGDGWKLVVEVEGGGSEDVRDGSLLARMDSCSFLPCWSKLVEGGVDDPPGDHTDPAHFDESFVEVFGTSTLPPVGELDPGDHMDPVHAVCPPVLVVFFSSFPGGAHFGGWFGGFGLGAVPVWADAPGDHTDPAHFGTS